MPVYTCSGPECPRLISVSAIPGGSPVALADPEGYAVEYLQCRSCKKYFCDRSLVKLGLNMQATQCPGCKGALFNPNAATAAQPATAQPATSQFQKTTVTVTGKSLMFPTICVCCGGPSDTTYTITGYNTSYSGRTRTTTTAKWPISSCTKCSPHFDMSFASYLKATDGADIKYGWRDYWGMIVGPMAFGFLAWVMVEDGPLRREIPRDLHLPFAAFAAVLGFLFYRALSNRKLNKKRQEAVEKNVAAKNESERKAKAKASLGPNCCRDADGSGANCIDYSLKSGNTHSFTFYRKDFADTFVRLNKANTVSVETFNK